LVSAGARSSSALAYDSRAERAVLFGGTVYGSRNSAALILGDTQIFGALVPASVRTFGAPCSGIAVPPVLTSGAPSIGTSRLRLDLVRAPAFAACAFGFSVSAQSLAFGNCTLYLGAPITILPGLTHAEGFATTSVDVPFEPALRGQVVHAQAFVVDALHAPLGVSFTAPLQCLVGD
jgi:hypothetical protein